MTGARAARNCAGGARQDEISAYSPGCLAFTGDNGGAALRGITNNKADNERTFNTLPAYFNKTYQLYGRQVKIVRYQGRGDQRKEIGGGGQEAANADALKVGQEIKAFGDLSATTQPYLDALVRQKEITYALDFNKLQQETPVGPGDYTPTDDARELYYDRKVISAFKSKPGRWIVLNGGKRDRGATWPAAAPAAPIPPPAAP